jgi:hypothetical protein
VLESESTLAKQAIVDALQNDHEEVSVQIDYIACVGIIFKSLTQTDFANDVWSDGVL